MDEVVAPCRRSSALRTTKQQCANVEEPTRWERAGAHTMLRRAEGPTMSAPEPCHLGTHMVCKCVCVCVPHHSCVKSLATQTKSNFGESPQIGIWPTLAPHRHSAPRPPRLRKSEIMAFPSAPPNPRSTKVTESRKNVTPLGVRTTSGARCEASAPPALGSNPRHVFHALCCVRGVCAMPRVPEGSRECTKRIKRSSPGAVIRRCALDAAGCRLRAYIRRSISTRKMERTTTVTHQHHSCT